MLGTHSEPSRGEMSHICDISLIRVNGVVESKVYMDIVVYTVIISVSTFINVFSCALLVLGSTVWVPTNSCTPIPMYILCSRTFHVHEM